jgi:hypothetical protein
VCCIWVSYGGSRASSRKPLTCSSRCMADLPRDLRRLISRRPGACWTSWHEPCRARRVHACRMASMGLDHGVGHRSCLCVRQRHLRTGEQERSRAPASCCVSTRGRRGDCSACVETSTAVHAPRQGMAAVARTATRVGGVCRSYPPPLSQDGHIGHKIATDDTNPMLYLLHNMAGYRLCRALRGLSATRDQRGVRSPIPVRPCQRYFGWPMSSHKSLSSLTLILFFK